MTTEIRPATLDDARGAASVHVRSWQQAYRGMLDQRMLDRLSIDDWEKRRRRWILNSQRGWPTDARSDASHRLLVADVDGVIAGWASYGAGRDRAMTDLGELAGLYVDPDFWGAGPGPQLLTAVEDALRAEGWQQAYLWVLEGNQRAIDFYGRHGWHADGAAKTDLLGNQQVREVRHLKRL